jgi:vacuolar protein sorting-associated protein 13A/C
MLRPFKRRLRRTFQTGLWLQMKTSPHQVQLHAKVNRLQIDDQMYDCVFPVVLAPVPPPKSVAADSGVFNFNIAVYKCAIQEMCGCMDCPRHHKTCT